MRTELLKAVCVFDTETEREYYEEGKRDVTSVEWGMVSGHMAGIDTVRVFKNGKLHSEHVFTNCLGVYFKTK